MKKQIALSSLVDFDGKITPAISAMIKMCRLAPEFRVKDLCRILNVSRSALYRWEKGLTRLCHKQARVRLRDFILKQLPNLEATSNGDTSRMTLDEAIKSHIGAVVEKMLGGFIEHGNGNGNDATLPIVKTVLRYENILVHIVVACNFTLVEPDKTQE